MKRAHICTDFEPLEEGRDLDSLCGKVVVKAKFVHEWLGSDKLPSMDISGICRACVKKMEGLSHYTYACISSLEGKQ